MDTDDIKSHNNVNYSSATKRKKIITIQIVFAFIILFLVLFFCKSDNSLGFIRIKNNNTNQLTSIGTSIFLYICLYFFIGSFCFAYEYIVSLIFNTILHRNDSKRYWRGKYGIHKTSMSEDIDDTAAGLSSAKVGYGLGLIIICLYAFGIITI